jgi:hypothetical protein
MDWTAWGGIGMATRGSIPTVMKQAGIDMLPPEAGIPWIRRELTAGAFRGEVVVAQRLGLMLEEFAPAGGLATDAGAPAAVQAEKAGIMVQRVLGMGPYRGLEVASEFDPAEQPFLKDHQIGGTPVLPGVMGVEAMVEAARLLRPDLRVASVEDVHFLAPFKFYRSEPRTVTVQAEYSADGEDVLAHCRLIGSRTLHGRQEAEVTTHFTARVRLTGAKAGSEEVREAPPGPENGKISADDIYRVYFHGPAYQVIQESWRAGDEVVGLFARELPANHEPRERSTAAAPRFLEFCFQTAGLGELAGASRMGLPSGIGRVTFHALPEEDDGRWLAVVRPAGEGSFDAEVLDREGRVRLRVEGYRTMALPDPVSEELVAPMKSALG